MKKENHEKVLKWIENNFEMDCITVEEFPLFPCGKRIKDENGGEMVAYYDLLRDTVKTTFPDEL